MHVNKYHAWDFLDFRQKFIELQFGIVAIDNQLLSIIIISMLHISNVYIYSRKEYMLRVIKLKYKLLVAIGVAISLFGSVSTVFAAAPDGAGPWADTVLSFSQGVMKNGLAVPPARSNPNDAVGVAELSTTSGFFSLGFGGYIILGFDNGMSDGAIIIESTNPNYPLEAAKVDMSQDGINWIPAGEVLQDGRVNQPEEIECVRYVRITDTSSPNNFPDEIADGYDVDGVQTTGDSCDPIQTPTPIPSSTPTPTPTPTNPPSSPTPTPTPAPCVASDINTIPSFLEASRVSPTSIFLSWGPFAGFNDFVIRYGFENNNWLYNTKVSGFSTTINDLPANRAIWFQVAATDNCAVGTYGASVLVGGTTTGTGGFVPGFPETGGSRVPRLPNTGLGPKSQSSGVMGIAASLLSLITMTVFTLIRR